LVVLGLKTGHFMIQPVTDLLQSWGRRSRCVLLFDQFEFFFVLVTAYIVHLAQFVELAQSQTSFTQIFQRGLAVVLTDVLIATSGSIVYFVEVHAVFISPALRRHHRQVLGVLRFRVSARLWLDLLQAGRGLA